MSSTGIVCRLARAFGLVLALSLVVAPLGAVQAASSGIVFVGTPGNNPPPPTLGPYTMIPFPPDGRPVPRTGDGIPWQQVTSVPGPTGNLTFSAPMTHMLTRPAPGPYYGWISNWTPGYTGDIYFTESGVTSVVMTLPPNTLAFYFYVDPSEWRHGMVTATAQDGTTSGPVDIGAADIDAHYFGFYTTGAPLTSITVQCSTVYGFAVGQFGIYGPKPECGARADVSVVVYGGWDGIAVNAYVGGTQQPEMYTARDAFGEAAVLWTFYPSAAGWPVSVAAETPAGLDATRWQYRLVRMEVNGQAVENPGSAGATILPCSEHVFYLQLVDTGALPAEE